MEINFLILLTLLKIISKNKYLEYHLE